MINSCIDQPNDLGRRSNEVVTQLDGSIAGLIQRTTVLESTNSTKLSKIENMLTQSGDAEAGSHMHKIGQYVGKHGENKKNLSGKIKKLHGDHSKTLHSVATILTNILTVT